MPRTPPEPVIEVTAIHKRFGGVIALRGVDFSIWRGEICALLGQNGAGKSTLVKILNGVHPAGSFEGNIRLDGQPVSFRSPAQARASGMGYVPQEIEVLEQLSVAENVFAGHLGLGQGVLVQRRRLEAMARAIFDEIGIDLDPKALVAMLSAAQRHLVMIARALALKPRVLILDEPTASLSGSETQALFGVLARLKAQGVAMIYITHRLPEVMAVCDRAAVLRDGRVAVQLARDEFEEERFIFAMSGQRLQTLFPEHEIPVNARTVLEVENPSKASPARFTARAMSVFRSKRVKSWVWWAFSGPGAAKSCTVSMAANAQPAVFVLTGNPSPSVRPNRRAILALRS